MTPTKAFKTLDLAQFSVCQTLNIDNGEPNYGQMLACLRELRELFREANQDGHDKYVRLCSSAAIGGGA